MVNLLSLHPELVLEVARYLDLPDVLGFSSTCCYIRAILPFDKFLWLVEHFHISTPERDQALRGTGSFMLSHFLLLCLERFETHPTSHVELDSLARHGGSLAHIAGDASLRKAILRNAKREMLDLMIHHGASIHSVPGGSGKLLREVFEIPEPERYNPTIQWLLDQGASFDDIEDLYGLFERTILEGPSLKLDLLLEHGCRLRRVPEGISELYDRVPDWDSGASGDSYADFALEKVLTIFQQLDKDVPGAVPLELGQIFQESGPDGPVRTILGEIPHWSLRDVPGGLEALFPPMDGSKSTLLAIIYLVQEGAFIESAGYDKNKLLRQVLQEIGPGSEAEVLINHCGASLQEHEANELLAVAYIHHGLSFKAAYLIDTFGANLRNVPQGLPRLLERTVMEQGLGSPAAQDLVTLYKVPLTYEILVSEIKSGGADFFYEECYNSIMRMDVPSLLHTFLEEAFIRRGKAEVTQFLLGKGASFDKGSRGVRALLETTFETFGCSPHLDFILEQTKTTMHHAHCDFNRLLELELFDDLRPSQKVKFANADFLLSQGASVDRLPRGASVALSNALNRYGYAENVKGFVPGEVAEWLLNHGAPEEPLQKWKDRKTEEFYATL